MESSHIPASLQHNEPLYQLYHGTNLSESEHPSTLRFTSKGGKAFLLIAKSRKWGKDFWLDLISPELQCDLVVESWRRGAVTPMQDDHSREFDEDLLNMGFTVSPSLSYEWPYTKDHAKWAVALKNRVNAMPWVCVADLNRMVSQEKRGGASLCFQESCLWEALKNSEEKLHMIPGPS
jgi:deoxyribonuclease-2